jgi:Holliday junction DNA helicase RuvA
MYNHLQGRLTEKTPTYAVLECGGVGYLLNISLHTFGKLGSNEQCKLLVHLAVKEDALLLYGFADEEERRLFRLLISVSGIGENTARMMLSSLSPTEIQQAILSANVPVLQSIKGIGNKTAQRIVLDLKDKLSKNDNTNTPSLEGFATVDQHLKDQAMSALLTLGFGKPAVEKVLHTILRSNKETPSLEQVIKSALNQL